MHYTASFFEAMFAQDDDPWQFKSRWYEERKRALTLACLPARRYASGYEPGCANGELSAALASRCDRLLVTDGSQNAVDLATARLAGLPHVEVRQAWVPEQWPLRMFDLIVLSEFGFYMDGPQLDAVAAATLASLGPAGTVLACHWRRPVEASMLDGDQVHRLLAERLALPVLCQVLEPDLRIDVWCRDPRSVAQREGFV
jgi:SAM-dependent methyltransferase